MLVMLISLCLAWCLVEIRLQALEDARFGIDIAEEQAAATLVVARHLQGAVAVSPVAVDGHGRRRTGAESKR